MAMPMQISLDEIISMLLSRVESLAVNDENNKTRFNVIARVLYKKGIITDDDVLESVKAEHRMLKDLGLIQEEPPEDVAVAVTDSLLQWIKGDVTAIKQSMEEYEKKLKEYAAQQSRSKPSIAVASSDVLQQLDKMGSAAKPGSKLIL